MTRRSGGLGDRQLSRRTALGVLGGGLGAALGLSACVAGGPRTPDPLGRVAVAGAGDSGRVSYWNQFTGADERAGFESVTRGFARAYSRLRLSVEAIPNADFLTKYTTAVQSGSVPDTVMTQLIRVKDMQAMRGLVDLTDSVSEWSGLADIQPRLLEPFTFDGRLYALPAAVFVDWMYCRADWLERAGIEAPPRTWDEFRAAARAMTDAKAGRYGFGMRGGAGGGELLLKLFRSLGGPLVGGDGAPRLQREVVEAALEMYTAPYTADHSVPPSAPADGYNQIFQSFLTGRTGMIFHHTGSLRSVIAGLKPETQVIAAPMPRTTIGEVGWVVPVGNSLMTGKHAPAALAWIQHWASAQAQLGFFDATGYYPAASSAQRAGSVTSVPLISAAAEQFRLGVAPEYFIGAESWQNNSVLVQLQAVLIGRSSVSRAAQTIMTDYRAAFEVDG